MIIALKKEKKEERKKSCLMPNDASWTTLELGRILSELELVDLFQVLQK